MTLRKRLLALVAVAGLTGAAWADITVGITVSATGPAASLGIPEKNTVSLMPKTIGGEKVNYIVLDDASDTTAAVTNTRKLISENKVDIVIGSTTTPNSLAMIDVVAEAQVPMISMAASARIVEPVDAKKRWVFKTPQNDILMAMAIATHMADNGVRSVAFIGFADAYGEGWYQEFVKAAGLKKLQIVANERYNRADTSVTGQVLKIVSARPDAVLIAGSGTPAALPQKPSRSAASTARSTRPTAWPTTISCASAAKTAKARCCPRARCWWPASCPTTIRSKSRPWPMCRPMKGRTARAR